MKLILTAILFLPSLAAWASPIHKFKICPAGGRQLLELEQVENGYCTVKVLYAEWYDLLPYHEWHASEIHACDESQIVGDNSGKLFMPADVTYELEGCTGFMCQTKLGERSTCVPNVALVSGAGQ